MSHLPPVPSRSGVLETRQERPGAPPRGLMHQDWVRWFLEIWRRLDLHLHSAAAGYWADLGGSRQVGDNDATWFAVPEYCEWVAPITATFVVRVQIRTSDAGTSVTPRLYDMTAGSAVTSGTGVASTSTSWTEQTLSVSLTKDRRYRLELLSGNTLADVFGKGAITG